MDNKTLLHICCAPCSVMCIESLRGEEIEPHGFWYNPNIHPYTEYRARKNTLVEYAQKISMSLTVENTYGLREFVKNVADDIDGRCSYCYEVRLEKAAEFAAANGFSSFTTTLLISPYQKHDLIAETAKKCGERHGVEFLYRDFRPLFREGQQKAREAGMYMQKYCGCIFSEEDRYLSRR